MVYIDYITPNDEDTVSVCDSDSIQNAINKAVSCGCRKVVIPHFNKRSGNFEWIIEKTVVLPDDIYLILDNCHLTLADGVFCNMFVNENCYTEKGKTVQGTNRGIVIEGNGKAILDGGNYNGYSELSYDRENGPAITNNCTLMFRNVDGFTISGLHFRNQRYWAMNFVFC